MAACRFSNRGLRVLRPNTPQQGSTHGREGRSHVNNPSPVVVVSLQQRHLVVAAHVVQHVVAPEAISQVVQQH